MTNHTTTTEGVSTMRAWFRNAYGSITDGQAWSIYRDTTDGLADSGIPTTYPWSLWAISEGQDETYVGNFATVEDAKAWSAGAVDVFRFVTA